MNNHHLRDEAFRAVTNFLNDKGWMRIDSTTTPDWGQWIDPITMRSHDLDHAFTVQLTRDQMEPNPDPSRSGGWRLVE